MSDQIPDDCRHDPHDPDLFILRCPDCDREDKCDSRASPRARTCGRCNRLMGVTPVSKVSTASPGDSPRVLTDGGTPEYAENRQADALESLADQTRVQNAVLLELTHELTALRRHQQGDLPHEFSAQGKAGSIEDRALELAERVDLDAVAMWTDEEPLTDGGTSITGHGGEGPEPGAVDDSEPATDPVDPEMVAAYTPAFVISSNAAKRFVADYSVLDSGWIRVRDWDGETWKYPPHKVGAIRHVRKERYGESNRNGFKPERLADEDLRERAREKGGAGGDE